MQGGSFWVNKREREDLGWMVKDGRLKEIWDTFVDVSSSLPTSSVWPSSLPTSSVFPSSLPTSSVWLKAWWWSSSWSSSSLFSSSSSMQRGSLSFWSSCWLSGSSSWLSLGLRSTSTKWWWWSLASPDQNSGSWSLSWDKLPSAESSHPSSDGCSYCNDKVLRSMMTFRAFNQVNGKMHCWEHFFRM